LTRLSYRLSRPIAPRIWSRFAWTASPNWIFSKKKSSGDALGQGPR
jgi:hypothetical protein